MDMDLNQFTDHALVEMADTADGLCRGGGAGSYTPRFCVARDQFYEALVKRGYCVGPAGHGIGKARSGKCAKL